MRNVAVTDNNINNNNSINTTTNDNNNNNTNSNTNNNNNNTTNNNDNNNHIISTLKDNKTKQHFASSTLKYKAATFCKRSRLSRVEPRLLRVQAAEPQDPAEVHRPQRRVDLLVAGQRGALVVLQGGLYLCPGDLGHKIGHFIELHLKAGPSLCPRSLGHKIGHYTELLPLLSG